MNRIRLAFKFSTRNMQRLSNRVQSALLSFHFSVQSVFIGSFPSTMIGKWIVTYSQMEKGLLLSSQWRNKRLPVPGCKYVYEPSFRTQRLRLDRTSSTIFPLSVTLSLPHRGLWALKSPTIINGVGSCSIISVSSRGWSL